MEQGCLGSVDQAPLLTASSESVAYRKPVVNDPSMTERSQDSLRLGNVELVAVDLNAERNRTSDIGGLNP
jgi:hypothetical protein